MQKIGIYGGTFDPVHHAHLILAREVLEQFELEKIIFVPAATSPHKQAPIVSADIRLRMLEAAIAGETQFEIDSCELDRPAPSYTIDTVEQLVQKYRGARLFYLIGDDNLARLSTWRRFEDLCRIVRFVVLQRSGIPLAHEYLSVQRCIDISATGVRDRVAAGRTIRYLVPGAVEAIIQEQNLYREVSK